ncbi:MAG: respiratory nitrate reductase subunit beta, partial [Deltaproteobacteria bacterium]|nr:respiratory nitrate reductase subunit beta [Deltaproteobacteria bacterium]
YNGADYQWWIKVNTMPGRGSPRDWEKMGGGYDAEGKLRLGHCPTVEEFGDAWEFNYEEVFYSGNGREYLRPRSKPAWGPNWDEDIGAGAYPNGYFFYLPRLCNQCSRPACAEACPQKAITKRQEDGIVIIGENCRSRGACEQECMRACPYKVIYFNSVKNVAQMCNFCLPRLQRGVAIACLRQCPGRAARIGFLDEIEGPVAQLVHTWKVALPLHPEFGTTPNVYYIPPLSPPRIDRNGAVDPDQPRIPVDYLRSLFGAEVEAALETLKQEMVRTRRGEKSLLMDLLISRKWTDLLGPYTNIPTQAKQGDFVTQPKGDLP